ncbi:MAG TPA: hypothetical protein VKB24_03265 [Candidatus Acidoferrum sp.]|nr:hypothetical protein [Candidatus Acidoferrum sp.]
MAHRLHARCRLDSELLHPGLRVQDLLAPLLRRRADHERKLPALGRDPQLAAHSGDAFDLAKGDSDPACRAAKD